ncbi:MAG: hypothetical protein A3J48_00430 [Candidatus Doudnabacteria bacterium RIFCSPHIGHO2_02_FULL_46_11]|uniref:POTRA domain-containing protein n=1 Tax=Candidatus Doudnabacteria bacterium RIFCSPHIGHO2_02_FULL_46_11 TaxID=1817832 RepID=A0A1F5P4U8_9BACT|nr:MAG: hypothetical protein A3J48_00430 [Candidatus Doudnabacteria bacterium RIFCSPHIGHO2_02_FULL_46_11]
MTLRFNGRGRATGLKNKVNPSLRFRRQNFQAKIETQKMKNSAKRYHSGGSFGIFTPVGLAAALGGLILVVVCSWFFVFSAKFLVNQAAIEGGTTLTAEQIDKIFYNLQDKRIFFIIPGNHYLFLDAKDISAEAQKLYPHIEAATNFQKDFPNKVVFGLAEKKYAFVLIGNDGRHYLVDAGGIVLGALRTAAPEGLIYLKTAEPSGSLLPGAKVLNEAFLGFAEKIKELWPAAWQFKPVSMEIYSEKEAGEHRIFTSEGWFIKTERGDNPENLIQNLSLILQDEIKTDEVRQNLAYIDLRLSNRAFYCSKGQACSR